MPLQKNVGNSEVSLSEKAPENAPHIIMDIKELKGFSSGVFNRFR